MGYQRYLNSQPQSHQLKQKQVLTADSDIVKQRPVKVLESESDDIFAGSRADARPAANPTQRAVFQSAPAVCDKNEPTEEVFFAQKFAPTKFPASESPLNKQQKFEFSPIDQSPFKKRSKSRSHSRSKSKKLDKQMKEIKQNLDLLTKKMDSIQSIPQVTQFANHSPSPA